LQAEIRNRQSMSAKPRRTAARRIVIAPATAHSCTLGAWHSVGKETSSLAVGCASTIAARRLAHSCFAPLRPHSANCPGGNARFLLHTKAAAWTVLTAGALAIEQPFELPIQSVRHVDVAQRHAPKASAVANLILLMQRHGDKRLDAPLAAV